MVGLGYVGLPLAVAFGSKRRTLGFDLNEKKLAAYRAGRDPSGEVGPEQLAAATLLEYTSDAARLKEAELVIIVVPTPIDAARQPDLRPLEGACRTVGDNLAPGAVVVFESTVYPGCTEEVCVPLLEQHSGLPWAGRPGAEQRGDGFYVGYSPERINPGDTEHKLESIVKVVSGDTPQTLERLCDLYGEVVHAGIHPAASIKVAEAAKVIENTQRDLNIALMNELALIFNRLDIDTLDVLEAAGTKWNFLPFRPGLVGGHCIGVDPYYLTYKAEAVGHHPQVILAGRQTNDNMGKFVAEQTVKCMAQRGHRICDAKVAVLGLTFKENCPDLRNSRVVDVISELREYRCNVVVHDPLADAAEAREEYGIELCAREELTDCQAVILAVPHAEYLQLDVAAFGAMMVADATIIDIKSVLNRRDCSAAGLNVWRV
ncbi:nucleotide sugar dehydrogenase [Seongchinamella sediminis]|uniref:nucleotide sugar dehydrogenase n=1 Tax=Seongchinamella sediminis TaxID=2283635 RepID=UPI001EEFDEE4|nr:nucleotide sugar dehydrogenase [Seongchinamella sediminis]